MTTVVSTIHELRALRPNLPEPVAVVMTMGALHPGHAALIQAARSQARSVIVTIFVNQLQFGPSEDFSRYPRTLDSDCEMCRQEGVDVVFAPPTEVMYPEGDPVVEVSAGRLGEIFEGASRKGHFDGVLTVVMKLLNLVSPNMAYFGEKDYQQLVAIRTMVRDLNMDLEVIGVPTVRESDGLARSSRNRYLSPSERVCARTLSRALAAGVAAGTGGGDAVLAAASAVLDTESGLDVDYLALTDGALRPMTAHTREARLLVAARIGTTRLIDNMAVEID